MNDLIKFGGNSLPDNPDELIKGLATVNQGIHGSSGGMPFLRLLKSGRFAYGPEAIEPELGSKWAVNPYSLMHGFACWSDGVLLDERMVPFNQMPPPRGELPDLGDDWKQQVSFQLRCMNGEDETTTVLYKSTSNGFLNAAKHLIDAIIGQSQVDSKHIVPIIELEADSYQHKKHGEIFYPVLNILEWVDIENGIPADEPEEETTADSADDEQKESSQKPETTASPRRRRRRRTAK